MYTQILNLLVSLSRERRRDESGPVEGAGAVLSRRHCTEEPSEGPQSTQSSSRHRRHLMPTLRLLPLALRHFDHPSVRMKPPRGPMASALDPGDQCNFTTVHNSGHDDAVVDGGLAHEGHARLSAPRPPPILGTSCSLHYDTNTLSVKYQARTPRATTELRPPRKFLADPMYVACCVRTQSWYPNKQPPLPL